MENNNNNSNQVSFLKLVPTPEEMELITQPKIYNIFLKDGGTIRIKAESYTDTEYGTFAFYKEDIDYVNKSYLKYQPPAPIYEIPRRDVSSIAQEGYVEQHIKPPNKRKKAAKNTKKTPHHKKLKSVLKTSRKRAKE